jgi:hypothetical protein
MSTATSVEAPVSPAVSAGLFLWLVAAIGSIFFIDYEPGRGAEGPFAGVPLAMLGVYFIVCSMFARDFVLYRLKIERAVRWYGEGGRAFGHVMYGLMGVGLLVAGGYLFVTG